MKENPNTHEISIITTEKDRKEFIEFPYRHYSHNKYWVAPLLMEQKKLINEKKNPFYNNAEIALFLAKLNGETAGRIAAIIDHRYNEFHKAKTGFFGFFESIDNHNTANLLFKVAEDWLREKGMEDVLGPSNPSMMDEIGILVDGFEKYPSILMPYHKPYYDKLAKKAGYEKEMDLLTYLVTQNSVDRERAERAVKIVKKRLPDLEIRKINMRKIKDEVHIIRDIFNEAWKNNWGFIPLSKEEFDALASDLKTIVDDDFAHIAEINGQPVGFSIALPDYNQIFRDMNGRLFPFGIFKLLWNKRKIDKVRTALMGVLPEYQGKGIDVLMHREAIQNGLEKGVHSSEVGWILENNIQMVRVAERIGGKLDKRYRMYSKKL
ncbi:GNAT family N-acetyltransferase [Rhodohalobacter sulfatireducens]|uniref:GNAT family N-acetyltransferase n=1 Tax=Rhodohalobacter sulfatireducens TaxID=2911366 RepID=A0ABS9KIL0_9BACT|nr:GNAT family N-acetyltransferase [Rhodohalobacter sulfatireducens]